MTAIRSDHGHPKITLAKTEPSTHATLVPYWARKLGRDMLLANQASPRGGWLDCELAGERVFLGGNAVTFMEATIHLPAAD